MPIVFDRNTGSFFEGTGPGSGVYGQMSLRRLCETLEAYGETRANERITHLEISGNLIRYRVELKEPR
jgi:hypothetical protein